MKEKVEIERKSLGDDLPAVSKLCLGTMMFGDQTDLSEARRIFELYREAGGNFIDTADVYAGGISEEITGELIKACRDEVVLATKVGNPMPDKAGSGGLSSSWLECAVGDCLKRLSVEQIDLLYLHREDDEVDMAETITAIGQLLESGKIRTWGFSNFRPWKIAEMVRLSDKLGVPRPIAAQPYYHLLNRVAEPDLLPACAYFGIGVVTYSPLARGVLTGKYRAGLVPSDSRAARKDIRITETEFLPDTLAAAEKAAEYADSSNQSLINLAVQWVLANRIVTSVLAGPRTVGQMKVYLAAIEAGYRAEDEAVLSSLCAPGHMATPGYNDPRYALAGRDIEI